MLTGSLAFTLFDYFNSIKVRLEQQKGQKHQ